MSAATDYADTEKGRLNENDMEHIERSKTAGGHDDDRSQPALPVVHRRLANPSPLGLLSFATGIFLISSYGVGARGVTAPNIMIGVLIFFGGVCQFLAGIMEFVSGNSFGATVFPSYGAFNLAYALIYLPGSGILASYSLKDGSISPEFNQALAIWLWAWFILTVLFTVAAMRSSWILFLDLFVLSVELLLLASGNMTGVQALLTAGNSLGFVVAFLSYWAGCAGLFAGGLTPFTVPTFPMYTDASG